MPAAAGLPFAPSVLGNSSLAAAIAWQVEGETADLFAGPDTSPPPAGPSFAVPRAFVDLARKAICHSDPERFALLYAMLLKLRVNRRALEDRADPLLDRLERMAKEVRGLVDEATEYRAQHGR